MPVIIHNKSHYSGDDTFVSTMQSMSYLISIFQTNTINDQNGLLYHLLLVLPFMPRDRACWHMCNRWKSKVLLSTAIGGGSVSRHATCPAQTVFAVDLVLT